MNGTIAKVIEEKGFGFIQPAGGGKDLFFHITGMDDRDQFERLNEGDSVSYDVDTDSERPRAVHVRLGN